MLIMKFLSYIRLCCLLLWVALPSEAEPISYLSELSELRGSVVSAETKARQTKVSVRVSSPTLEGERRAETNEQGEYVIGELPAGLYDLRYEATGFKSYVRRGVELRPNRVLRMDVTLAPVGTRARPSSGAVVRSVDEGPADWGKHDARVSRRPPCSSRKWTQYNEQGLLSACRAV